MAAVRSASTQEDPIRRATLAVLSAALTSVLIGTSFAGANAAPTTPAQTYYVNCGKKVDPKAPKAWRSLSAVQKHGRFQPGDKVLLKRGTTCRGSIRLTGSGTAASKIVLGAYGSGARPTIAGGGTGQKTGAVTLKNVQHWTVENLHVTNRSTGKYTTTYRSGVLIVNTGVGRLAGITVQKLAVDNVTSNLADSKTANSREYGGISALTTKGYGSGFDGLRILSNTVNGVGRTGIVTWNSVYQGVYDSDTRIAGNVVRSARGDSVVTVGIKKSRIDHNRSANGSNLKGCPNCGRVSPHMANAAFWVGGARTLRVDHNEAYGEHRFGGDGEGFDIDRGSVGVVLEYNYAHGNEGGGVLLCGSVGAVVRFNIFEDNERAAVTFIGTYPAKDSKIYNNTIYSGRGVADTVVRTFNGLKGSGVLFRNNLVYHYGAGHYIWPTKKRTNAANTLVGRLGPGRPAGKGTSTKDPGLKKPGSGGVGFASLGGYKPKRPSTFPRGLPVPASVTTDFFGKRIDPKHPPRGAAG